MKYLITLFLLSLTPALLASQPHELRYHEHGFHADWFEADEDHGKLMIVYGGSEGGNRFGNDWAPELNQRGFHVLSIAYFNADGLPGQLELIPLEHLDAALRWVDEQNPDIRVRFIAGVSKGAEKALIQAERLNVFDGVIAIAPSSVAWQSINQQDFMSRRSSWSLNGEPVDFLEYDYSQGWTDIFTFYNGALDNSEKAAKARIKAEHINAPLLLISGSDDKLWPAARMSEAIVELRKKSDNKYPVYHKNIPDAGHMLFIPGITGTDSIDDMSFQFLGGSREKLVEHVGEVSRVIYGFLDEYGASED